MTDTSAAEPTLEQFVATGLLHGVKETEWNGNRSSVLGHRYQQQMLAGRDASSAMTEKASRLLGWTWIPGRDRRACPDIVDIRDPRMIVMGRIPETPTMASIAHGMVMYRPKVTKHGAVNYASPGNLEMLKDFGQRPYAHANGLRLNAQNEEVFRAALAVDYAIDLACQDRIQTVPAFIPPRCLFGFPEHYTPTLEWRAPIHNALMYALHPQAPTMTPFLSKGCMVLNVTNANSGFRALHVDQGGALVTMQVPVWAILGPQTVAGNTVPAGVPLYDIPRGVYTSIRDVCDKFPLPALEWLQYRVLENATETVHIEESVFQHDLDKRQLQTTTWKCLPAELVKNQITRAQRTFLDFRQHLGRTTYQIDNAHDVAQRKDPRQVRIEVVALPEPLGINGVSFSDSATRAASWFANLLDLRGTAWAADKTVDTFV